MIVPQLLAIVKQRSQCLSPLKDLLKVSFCPCSFGVASNEVCGRWVSLTPGTGWGFKSNQWSHGPFPFAADRSQPLFQLSDKLRAKLNETWPERKGPPRWTGAHFQHDPFVGIQKWGTEEGKVTSCDSHRLKMIVSPHPWTQIGFWYCLWLQQARPQNRPGL